MPDSYEEKATDFKIDENGQKWRRMGNICWFTNLDMEKRHKELTLFKRYAPAEYPKYDNYDAIEVGKTTDIPCDYEGMICVPITFMQYHNPDQFEILGCTYNYGRPEGVPETTDMQPIVNGKIIYKRIIIRRRREGVV